MERSETCFARADGLCSSSFDHPPHRCLRVLRDAPFSTDGLRSAIVEGGVFAPRLRWMGWGYARCLREHKREFPENGPLEGWVPSTIQYRARACYRHGLEAFGLYPVHDRVTGAWFYVDGSLRFGNGLIRAVGLVTAPDPLSEMEA